MWSHGDTFSVVQQKIDIVPVRAKCSIYRRRLITCGPTAGLRCNLHALGA